MSNGPVTVVQGISLLPDVLKIAQQAQIDAAAAGLGPELISPETGMTPAETEQAAAAALAYKVKVKAQAAAAKVKAKAAGLPKSILDIKPPVVAAAGGVYQVSLPHDLHAKLLKPITGVGGWQSLMSELRAVTLTDQPVIMLPRVLLLTLIHKSVAHGSGGYQGVIRWLLCLTLAQHQGAILAPVK